MRRGVVEDPESLKESFFRCFIRPDGTDEPSVAMTPDSERVVPEPSPDGSIEGVKLRLDESLFQGEFALASTRGALVAVGEPAGADPALAVVSEERASGPRRGPLAFWLWTALAAFVAAALPRCSARFAKVRMAPWGGGQEMPRWQPCMPFMRAEAASTRSR